MVLDLRGLETIGPKEPEKQCNENAAIQRYGASCRHTSPERPARPSHDTMGSPLANVSDKHNDGGIHNKHNPAGLRSPPWTKNPTSPLARQTSPKASFGLRSPRISEALPGAATPQPLSKVEVVETPQRLRRESTQRLQKLCQKPTSQTSSRSLELCGSSLSSGVSTTREQTFLSDRDMPLSEIAVATIRNVDATVAADNMQKIVENFRASISSPVSASAKNSSFGTAMPRRSSVRDRRPSVLQGRPQTLEEPTQLLTKSWQPPLENLSPLLLRARSTPEFPAAGARGVEFVSHRRIVPQRLPVHSMVHGVAHMRPMSLSPRNNALTHSSSPPLNSASQFQPRCTTMTSVVSPPRHATGGSRGSLGASVCRASLERSRCFSPSIQLVNTPGFMASASSQGWAAKV